MEILTVCINISHDDIIKYLMMLLSNSAGLTLLLVSVFMCALSEQASLLIKIIRIFLLKKF